MTAEQKTTDREAANRERERDGVRPIRVRQMECNSSKKQPFGLQKEIAGGVPRFRNNLRGVCLYNVSKNTYI